MNRYIEQLIEDMRTSAANKLSPSDFWQSADLESPVEIEDMSYLEEYLYGTPKPLSEILGIKKEELPRDHLLDSIQVNLLYNEMEVLLNAYNFSADFPEELPVNLKYHFLRESWDLEQVHVGYGTVHIEFCNYDVDSCPFPCEYCDCKSLNEDDSQGMEEFT